MRTLLLILIALFFSRTVRAEERSISEDDRALWDRTVKVYLEAPLWEIRDVYDAGHHLLVPMEAAFQHGESAWQEQFFAQFNRFVGATGGLPSYEHNYINYIFAAAHFCVLAREAGKAQLIPPGLPEFCAREMKILWLEKPAAQWLRDPFVGLKARLAWKLAPQSTIYTYESGVLDDELWLFAIAAELKRLDDSGWDFDAELDVPAITQDILSWSKRVFSTEVTHNPNGGWLLQPGAATDFSQGTHANLTTFVFGMPESRRPGLSWDTSHSQRFPVVLRSLERAFSEGADDWNFYRSLRNGLARQFQTVALSPPTAEFPAWRTKNYMDGWNGYYQWSPVEGSVYGIGYAPYELSGTMLAGLWSFLETPLMRQVYTDLAASFPIPPERLQTYEGRPSSRNRHPLLAGPEKWNAGLYEMICRLAAKAKPAPVTPEAYVFGGVRQISPAGDVYARETSYDVSGSEIVARNWTLAGTLASNDREFATNLPVGFHTVELQVQNAAGIWSVPKALRFEVQRPPYKVELTAPDRRVFEPHPLFRWPADPAAIRYAITLTSSDGTEVITDEIVPTEGTVSWCPKTPLKAGLAYIVTQLDAIGEVHVSSNPGAWLGVSLTAPELLSPRGKIKEAQPLFRWRTVPGADRYLVHVVNTHSNTVLFSRTVSAGFTNAIMEWRGSAPLVENQLYSVLVIPGSATLRKGKPSAQTTFWYSNDQLRLKQEQGAITLELTGKPGAKYVLETATTLLGPWTELRRVTLDSATHREPLPTTDHLRHFRSRLTD